MIIMDSSGNFIEINILDFLTDIDYYKKFLSLKDIKL